MSLRIAVQMDPLEAVNPAGDFDNIVIAHPVNRAPVRHVQPGIMARAGFDGFDANEPWMACRSSPG